MPAVNSFFNLVLSYLVAWFQAILKKQKLFYFYSTLNSYKLKKSLLETKFGLKKNKKNIVNKRHTNDILSTKGMDPYPLEILVI